jgi:hypothetical protein
LSWPSQASSSPKETIDLIGWDFGIYRGIVFLVLLAYLALLVFLRSHSEGARDRLLRDDRLCSAVLIHFEAMLRKRTGSVAET